MGTKELVGKIILQENIDTVDRNKIAKTFVIHVPDPYKSYYSRFSDLNKPNSVIFITKSLNSFEKILRVTRRINSKYNLNLSGAKCEVAIGSRKLFGVRIKGIENYSDIEQVQTYYLNEGGFDYAKSETFKEVEALIRVNRFFNISQIEEGIFKSEIEEDVYYVEVPKFMNWEDFKTYTFEIKNNMPDRNYDIAKGIFYVNQGVSEILRIVKPKATTEFLKTIQKRYIEKSE